MFFLFWFCAWAAGCAVRRWEKRWGVESLGSRAGFVVVLLVASSAQFLLEPVSNLVSRHFEHEADVYGQEAIHGIVADPRRTAVSAFIHLGEASLDDPSPNPFFELWAYSHPSIQRRVRFAAAYDPWRQGEKPKFF